MSEYIGSTFHNDIIQLRHQKNSRQYFEDLKKYLKDNCIPYDPFPPAQIVVINGKAVYFVGSTIWWGISVNAVNMAIDKCAAPVYAVLFSSDKAKNKDHEEHYWLVKTDRKLEGKRVIFTENNGELHVTFDKGTNNKALTVESPHPFKELQKVLDIIC